MKRCLYLAPVSLILMTVATYAQAVDPPRGKTSAAEPSLAGVVDLFIEHAEFGSASDAGRIGHALLRYGDLDSAKRLLPYERFYRSEYTGLVAAYVPGAQTPKEARKLQEAAPLVPDNIAIGLVSGLAKQGRLKEAAAIAEGIKSDIYKPVAHAILLLREPTRTNLESFLKRFPHKGLSSGAYEQVAYAAVVAGDPALAKQMIEAAVRRSPNSNSFPDEVREAVIDAYLREGSRRAATTLAQTVKSALTRYAVGIRFAREPAREGDVAGVKKVLDAEQNPHAKEGIQTLMVYALAKSGDVAAATKLCDDAVNVRKSSELYSIRFGMLAAAQKAAGKPAEAAATVERALKLIKEIPDRSQKAAAAANLIRATALGPDYYSYGDFAKNW